MNVVDSSGWLEFFADGPNAAFFAKPIERTEELLVPTLSLFEVYKRVLQQRGEHDANQAAAAMQQGLIIPLDAELAIDAARLSLQEKLPLADSVILATARTYEATLWTQDKDFEGVPGTKYVAKK
jgi:predicted nucleic acid-binding protein